MCICVHVWRHPPLRLRYLWLSRPPGGLGGSYGNPAPLALNKGLAEPLWVFAGALREWLGMPLAKLNSPRQWWCRCSAGADGGIIVASVLRRLQFCFDCFVAVFLCFVFFHASLQMRKPASCRNPNRQLPFLPFMRFLQLIVFLINWFINWDSFSSIISYWCLFEATKKSVSSFRFIFCHSLVTVLVLMLFKHFLFFNSVRYKRVSFPVKIIKMFPTCLSFYCN